MVNVANDIYRHLPLLAQYARILSTTQCGGVTGYYPVHCCELLTVKPMKAIKKAFHIVIARASPPSSIGKNIITQCGGVTGYYPVHCCALLTTKDNQYLIKAKKGTPENTLKAARDVGRRRITVGFSLTLCGGCHRLLTILILRTLQDFS